jgi:hypothetical protein
MKLNYMTENDEWKSSYGLIIIFSILGVNLLLVIIFILWKFIKIKKSGLEFSLKNLKETPLLW